MAYEALKDNYCFGCGSKNPVGLHLNIEYSNQKASTTFYIDREHCGFSGLFHGGISTTILDEVMNSAVLHKGTVAVTKSMDVHFRKPGYVGHTVYAEGRITETDGRHIHTYGFIKDQDTGTLLVECFAVFVQVDLHAFLNRS